MSQLVENSMYSIMCSQIGKNLHRTRYAQTERMGVCQTLPPILGDSRLDLTN